MTEITSKQDEELNKIGECMISLGTKIAGNAIAFEKSDARRLPKYNHLG
jgi:hypothetical protein